MKVFEMQAMIIMNNNEEIVEALREIADAIENGTERGWIPGEVQGAEWYISDEEFDGEIDDEI